MASSGFDGQLHGDSTSPTPAPAGALSEIWRTRPDWVAGVVRYSPGKTLELWVLWVLGGACLALFFGLFLDLPRLLPQTGYYIAIPLVGFGGVGLALTGRAAGLTDRWLTYRSSHLRLAEVPTPLGGAFRGVLEVPKRLKSGQPIRLRLQCWSAVVHEATLFLATTQDDSDRRSTTYRVLWEDEDTVTTDDSGTVPVAFAVPADAPGTTVPNQSHWFFWQLEAEVPDGGTSNYRAEFPVPIVAVEVTPAQQAEARAIAERRQRALRTYEPSSRLKVAIRATADGETEFVLPPVRGAAKATFQTTVLFASVGLAILAWGAVAPAVSMFWGVINSLYFLWILRLWFAPERVLISRNGVTVTQGLFRIAQTIPQDQLVQIHAIAGPTTPNAIRILSRGWRHFTVAEGIRYRRDADWLAQRMCQAAGIDPAAAIPAYGPTEDLRIMTSFVADFAAGKIDFGPLGNALVRVLGPSKPGPG